MLAGIEAIKRSEEVEREKERTRDAKLNKVKDRDKDDGTRVRADLKKRGSRTFASNHYTNNNPFKSPSHVTGIESVDDQTVNTLVTLDSYHSGNTGYTFDSKDTDDTGLVLEASHKLNTNVVTMSYEF